MRTKASWMEPWLPRGAWCMGMAAVSLAGCIVESGDAACGKNQVRVKGEGTLFCECAPGYVVDTETGIGCLPCGKHEEAVQDECVCEEGYTRPSETAACTMSNLGGPCSDATECGGDVPLCVEGYCTSACESSLDCERGWVCEEQEEGGACLRAPEGFGMSCESNDDCAGTGATLCDSFQSHTCIVECSKSAPCPGDWVCCDISAVSIVVCLSPEQLEDGGACPGGGTVVTP